MNLTAGKLIRSEVSNSYSIEYTCYNSNNIRYISEYYRVYELRYRVIKVLEGYEIKRTSPY